MADPRHPINKQLGGVGRGNSAAIPLQFSRTSSRRSGMYKKRAACVREKRISLQSGRFLTTGWSFDSQAIDPRRWPPPEHPWALPTPC